MKLFLILTLLTSSLWAQRDRSNTVKKRLEQNKSSFGGFVTIPHYKVIENLAVSNKLQFVWIEAEHTEFGPKEVQELVMASENEGLTPVVRVPKNDRDDIKKYIGSGAQGIVVPNIRTPEDAKYAVASLKYPPLGQRPMGVERANRYLGDLENYHARANENMLVILMIETVEAIDNIEAIASIPGIDVLHLGPYDLSLAMGVPMDSPKLAEAIKKVEAAAAKFGVHLGKSIGSKKNLKAEEEKGYKFLVIPGDMEILRSGVKNFFN